MCESPEVEKIPQDPKGKTNVEAADYTEQESLVEQQGSKKTPNPKMPPSGNLENASQPDDTRSV